MKDYYDLRQLMMYFIETLHDTEMRWSQAVREVYDEVHSRELREQLYQSSEVVNNHVRILNEILKEMHDKHLLQQPAILKGVMEEMQLLISGAQDPEVRDAAVLACHQVVNHFKIAWYGTVCSYAQLLGEEKIAAAVHHLLTEEKKADQELTALAEGKVNREAQRPLIR
ncbi:MAG TPA: DUF892 family protein [Sphingobacteriaceae bacterium]